MIILIKSFDLELPLRKELNFTSISFLDLLNFRIFKQRKEQMGQGQSQGLECCFSPRNGNKNKKRESGNKKSGQYEPSIVNHL